MVFEIKSIKNNKLDKIYEDSMKEFGSFFELDWKDNRPNIIIVPDRRTIDLLKGTKTENWLVGWTNGTDVYILDYRNYEKESAHEYSDEEYSALIKHEMAHCFSNIISGFSKAPIWLLEGISIFLSGQNKFKAKPKNFSNFIDFYDKFSKEVYYESGFAVEFLVKTYGKEKLLKLLKGIKNIESKEDFASLFKSIYKFDLEYRNFKVL